MFTESTDTAGRLRAKRFFSLIMKDGNVSRGALIAKMDISNGIFAREYKDFLEAYPMIHYNSKTREFSYEP